MKGNRIHQSGQILLIVVLVMVVSLTVGLSLVSRSLINLKNSSEESNSQKAFQAAEAGVEIGLQKSLGDTISIGQKTLDNGAVIQKVSLQTLAGSSITLNNGNPVAQDTGLDVWLTQYPDYSGTPWSGKLYVYWGSKNGCQDAALEAIVISGASALDPNATINRYGVDPCGANSIDASQNRTGSNNLSPAQGGASINGEQFKFSTAISITNGLLIRLIPLYSNTPIGIVGYNNNNPPQLQNFPAQGRFITSTGVFPASPPNTQRQVSFFQGYPLLPSEFFYSVFQK